MVPKQANWLAIAQFLARRVALIWMSLYAVTKFFASRDLKSVASSFNSIVVILLWILTGALLIGFLFQNFSKEVITIDPISVPKLFSDNGYTPEVASHRLRDALVNFATNAGTSMRGPQIALRGDLPDIVVPKIDISIDTVVSSVRNLLHYGNRRTVSGEFVFGGKLAWLRLRVDGRDVYSSPHGFDIENPDALLTAAASAVVETFQPYLVAAALYESDPQQALEKANAIIAGSPDTDSNVQWSYVLKSRFFNDHADYDQGKIAAETAIHLNDENQVAHNNLGFALRAQGEIDKAVAEFRDAIELDPRYALPHINLGLALMDQGKAGEAFDEYRRAIQLDPKTALPHNNLGFALNAQGRFDEAITEYRRAIVLNPKFAIPHNNLGVSLKNQGKLEEAVVEYRRAIELNPKAALPHKNLGDALKEQGKIDEAAAEYRRAIELAPNAAAAHTSLGVALKDQGKIDEAIVEYRRAIELDPNDARARADLEVALRPKTQLP
jgi:tetratricopeptide (TPR) repeat protein